MRDSKKGNEEAQRGVAKGSQGRNKKGEGRNKKQRWRATKEGTQEQLMNLKASVKLTLGTAKLS
jgi:hypothetical protein